MANVVTTQTLLDGPRNCVVLLTGVLDTSNEANTIKVDVSALDPPCEAVTVERVQYSTSGSLKVLLTWEATADVTFAALAGQGEIDARCCSGLRNNAGAGVTGDVGLATVGWASGTETYTVLLEMRKVNL